MKKIRTWKRMLALVLSIMMLTLGIPLQAQAASSDWSQLANKNEEWIYGNLNHTKSTYVEGMSVPQRLILTNIESTTESAIHYVDFEYQFTKSGKYAYDFITSWDQAKEAADDKISENWDDNWIWKDINSSIVTTLKTTYVDVDIPTNNHAGTQEQAYESEYGNRSIRIFSSKPLLDASISMDNSLDGSVTKDSKLGFRLSWHGDAEDVIILYASHIAIGDGTALGWGAGMGASGISGSPYHNYVVESSEWSGSSRRDNQMQISEQIEISGIKWNDEDKDGIKDNDEGGIKGFEIWADINNNGVNDDTDPSTFTDKDGKYSLSLIADKDLKKVKIYEVQKNGFVQTYPTAGYHELSINKKDDAFTNINFGNFEKLPKIEVIKSVSPLTMPEPGGEFTYTFVVKNIGNVPVTLTEVNDNILGVISLPSDVNLEPGEVSAAMIVKVIHSDVDVYNNTVTARAVDGDSNVVTDTDNASVEVTDVLPNISVTKTASPTSLPKGGGEFTFTYVVTNIGDVPVTVKSVVDDKLGSITLPEGVYLLPGESTVEMSKTQTYTVTGSIINIVTAIAEDNEGNEDSATDQATVTVLESDSSITVIKTASPKILPEPGGEFTYTYKITNNGKISVNITKVYDDVIGDIQLPTDTTLEPGEFMEVTGKYTYTDNGTYKNTVNVTAIDSNQKTITAETTETVTVTDTKPSIQVTKTASPTTLPAPGGTFTYKFVVKNIGTVPVTLMSVVDNVLGEIELPADVELSPGEISAEMTATMNHDRVGTYPNTVTATAYDYDENMAIASANASVEVTRVIVPEYKLEITKEADVTEYDSVNDVINYTIKLRNTGNSELTEVTVSDPLIGTLTGPTGDTDEDEKLDINETWTYTGSYTIVQEDIIRGFVENTATADSKETDDVKDSVTVDYDEPGNPPTDNSRYRMTIEKDADVSKYSSVGDVINYTITLENTGNRGLTGVKVTDPMLDDLEGPDGDTDNDNVLDTNETWTYTGSYTVTAADMEKDSIINTAEADSNQTSTIEDSVTVDKEEEEDTEIVPADVPLGGEPQVPEIIEEQPVPQATLPNTGRFFNTTMLAVIGSMLVLTGLALNRKKRIKE